MDAKFNRPTETEISYLKIIFMSFIPSIIFGLFAYFFFEWYILSYKADAHSLNLIYCILSSVIFYLLFIFIGITYGKIFLRKNTCKSFNNLREFTDALHSSSNEKGVYENLYMFISNFLKTSKIFIHYKNTSSENINVWENYPGNSMPICNMNPRSCPVICNGNECFVNDIHTELTCAYQLPYFKSGSYVCLLMKFQNSPNCVVQLYNHEKNYFDKNIVNDIRAYIEITEPVLEGIKQIKNLNQEAYTDKLTQVSNRTFFEQEIDKLIENSNKNGEPLSMIIVDLDHFKQVNDNYGHPAGDCILIEFASIILNCIRAGDICCRYGGEEFLILLPNANAAYASSIAERVRAYVANSKMPIFQGTQLPNITCSLGVSTYPDYSTDRFSLLKTADLALYSAKHNGRNRVITYDPYNAAIQNGQ